MLHNVAGVKGRSGVYNHLKIRGRKKSPMSDEVKHKISLSKKGTTPWNKGLRNKQTAWNKGMVGYMSGSKNPRFVDGLSKKQRNEKMAGRARPNICEVCYTVAQTDFDHSHATGEFRGWLCRRCNLVLGMVKDNQILLRNLALYLDIQSENTRPKSITYGLLINNSNAKDSKPQ